MIYFRCVYTFFIPYSIWSFKCASHTHITYKCVCHWYAIFYGAGWYVDICVWKFAISCSFFVYVHLYLYILAVQCIKWTAYYINYYYASNMRVYRDGGLHIVILLVLYLTNSVLTARDRDHPRNGGNRNRMKHQQQLQLQQKPQPEPEEKHSEFVKGKSKFLGFSIDLNSSIIASAGCQMATYMTIICCVLCV